jgi:isopenicillin-N N-acyltransferase-like protein
MAIQHVRVEGSGYQRGFQYGRQAADRVRRSVQAYRLTFEHFAGWDWGTVRREAARFEAPVQAFRPAYLEEMAVMDLTAGQFWLAAGNPCQAPYEQLTVKL